MIEEVYNPNQAHRKRKKNKKHECVPTYLPDNMPVAHTTVHGKGVVGRLRKKKRGGR